MDGERDWSKWHAPYDDPGSPLAGRLAVVQRHIEDWLDETPGAVRVLSACAGDGRDLLGVLGRRDDARRVTAELVELDERTVARARASIHDLGLAGVGVRQTDAGLSTAYLGAVPASLVLLCGIFGNVSDTDVRRLVRRTPQLCSPGARVIWTRHTRAPDLTPHIRGWFAESEFTEVSYTAPSEALYSVGVHHLRGAPAALAPGERWFSFVR